ncbi:Piwi-domain-containing protein [Annulohypoxylon moriforme]|nr:Piwi-domain-containing protein [Annulohypoxylon moriforme]
MDRNRGNFNPGRGGSGYSGPSGNRDRNRGLSRARGRGTSINRSRDIYQGEYRNPPLSPKAEVTEKENATKLEPNVDESIIPRRPGHSTAGKGPVVLWANYIELALNSHVTLWYYKISFVGENEEQMGKPIEKPTGKKLTRVINLLLREIQDPNRGLVTDFNQILISCEDIKSIKTGGKTFIIRYYGEDEKEPRENAKSFQIKVELQETLPLSALGNYLNNSSSHYIKESMIQALNVFLNYYSKTSNDHTTIGAGRSFPLDEEFAKDLGFGLVAIRGYYSSIRMATSRILANVNVSYGMFYSNKNLDEIMDLHINDNPDYAALQTLGRFLRGVRIEYCYHKDKAPTRRIFKIHGLADTDDGTTSNNSKVENPPRVRKYGAGPKDVSFWFQDRRRHVSVFDFFKEERKQTLDGKWPVINVGSHQSPIYLPPELCKVLPGQRAKVEANPRQKADMINFAVRTPWQDMQDIIPGGMEAVGLDKEKNPMMDRYGLSIPNRELVTVESRVLPAPEVKYNKGKGENKPSWNLGGKGVSPNQNPIKLKCRVICNDPADSDALVQLRKCYPDLKANGVKIEDDEQDIYIRMSNNREDFTSAFEKALKDNIGSVDFMIVILPDSSKTTYNLIKRLGDIKYGIRTVCIVASTLKNQQGPLKSLAGNLVLKFSLKYGNNNQTVNEKSLKDIVGPGKTMIVGIDVTHSPIEDAPSIAGMVASHDKYLGQWPATIRRQQEKGEEMVEELEEMLESRIKVWNKKNNRYPESIIVYRDGVSEGQYKLVREKELPKLRDACRKLYPKGRMPKITIVVVGKRHHTRFYRHVKPDEHYGNNNPVPGTVVDRGVTETLNWDFFLQSHKPIKGTARPAHYFVVHDEIFRAKFGEDAANQLETFTHSLCYLFGRSTSAVSICTPAYYADIVCQRARCYADDNPGIENFEIHERLEDTMFYI